MNVNQAYEYVNEATEQILGKTGLVEENLTNIVDIGNEVFNTDSVDNYVKSLIDHVGRVIFVDRPYAGNAPRNILRDEWEYGAALEKITMDEVPEAVVNNEWLLTKGQAVDPFVFNNPEVSAKFFQDRNTFQIPMSFPKNQVKSAFSNAQQMTAFLGMIQNGIDRSMTMKTDSLIYAAIQRAICNALETLTEEEDITNTEISGKSGIRAVNLLYLYNQKYSQTLTASNALYDPEFIRFASMTISLYRDRISTISSLFNAGGRDRFTPIDRLNIIMLSEFTRAAEYLLYSDTFHENYVKFENFTTVPFWQGTGSDYGLTNTSAIKATYTEGSTTKTFDVSGILAVMFDYDAIGVSCWDRDAESIYNPRGRFWNYFYNFTAGFFNDYNENFIVFYIA